MASRKSIPVVFGHFDVPDNAEGNFKAKCKHCSTTIYGSTKSTSNFLLHLKVCTMYIGSIMAVCMFVNLSAVQYVCQYVIKVFLNNLEETSLYACVG